MERQKLIDSFQFVAIDIKTTGISPENNNIVEIGACLFQNGEKVSSYHSYIQPTFSISPITLSSLGISLNTLNHYGQPLKVVLKELADFAQDKTILFMNNSNQYEFLTYHIFKQNLIPFINFHYDVIELIKIYYPLIESLSFEDICNSFGFNHNDINSSEAKSELLGQLFFNIINHVIDKIPYAKNRIIYNLATISDLDSDLPIILQRITEYQQKTALLSKDIKIEKSDKHYFIESEQKSSDQPSVEETLGKDGLFSKQFANYEEREGQLMMSNAVNKAIRRNELLLVEAGTGVGKSFAYLVPAIAYSSRKDDKIIVSTNTKNLQEQLFYKDIPTLSKILPQKFTAIIMKGRENYICLRRWNEAVLNINNLSKFEAQGLLYLVIWKEMTRTGDISENSLFDKAKFPATWRKILSERYFCGGKKCSFYKSCHVMDVKKKLDKANLVIVNHSLLLADLMNDHQTLGEYKKVILDEAHNLPTVAGKHLGISLTYFDINQLLNHIVFVKVKKKIGMLQSFVTTVENTVPDDKLVKKTLISISNTIIDFIADSKNTFADFFDKLAQEVDSKGSYGKYRLKSKDTIPSFIDDLQELHKHWKKLKNSFFSLTETLRDTSPDIIHEYDQNLTNLEGVFSQISEVDDKFNDLENADWHESAIWLELLGSRNTDFPTAVINCAPVEVTDKLNEYLYNAVDTLVMTSATLAIRGVFKFFLNQSGLSLLQDRPIVQISVPSPFDYEKQAKLLLPDFLPLPKDSFYIDQAIKLLNELICETSLGSMVLFTSYRDLNYAFEQLQEPLFDRGIKLLAQGISGNRTAILNEFKKSKNSVLLGTSSFWEGVDVQGDSLSQLIVFKLPFQVPSEPLVEAYIEKLEAEKKNSFMHYMLPNALLKVRQGFGRLIRSKQDKGVVVILDKRVITTRYGSFFKQVLPAEMTIVKTDLELIDRTNKFFKSF